MNHEELKSRILELPGVGDELLPYLFQWASDGKPTPAVVTLIPQLGGKVTATWGDLRDGYTPVLGDDGTELTFPNETVACDWALTAVIESRADLSRPATSERAAEERNADLNRRLDAEFPGWRGGPSEDAP